MGVNANAARIESYNIKLFPFSLYCPSAGKEGTKNFNEIDPNPEFCPYCGKKTGKNKNQGECDLLIRRA